MFSHNIVARDGEYTKTVYTLIKEQRFADAIGLLHSIPEATTTRAGQSLLGHCYYQCQDFGEAANCYEQLCAMFPDVVEYKLYFAQSLFQSGLFDEAFRVTTELGSLDSAANRPIRERLLQLQSAIRYSAEDYAAAQAILLQRRAAHEATLNDEGCLLYQANEYDDALKRFTAALQTGGFNPLFAYNAALSHYRKKEHVQALNYIAEIVERGIRNHPELGIGAQAETEGGARSVGNPPALAQSGLAQSLNLKAAIEYQESNIEGAREALLDLPPRTEPELDPVTLHNLALTEPASARAAGLGLRRLAFLLELGPPACPPETFGNILLLCCRHEMYDTAADILAEHAHLTYRYLTPYLYDLLDALITVQTSAEEAAHKLDQLAGRLSTQLRTATGQVQEHRTNGDQVALRRVLREYEATLENYLPVAMARAWVPWREDDFAGAEREFHASAEFCSETPTWQLHAAHVLFMRGDKYKESAAFYEPVVRQNYDNILSVSAAVLANLCVAYIMTSQNEEAEELMRKVERAEERKAHSAGGGSAGAGGGGQQLHLCIVNLVIGTLYCAKNNYEFGLSRIAHALDGGSGTSLCADTWLHVKRCVLGLLAALAKQTIVLPAVAVQEVLQFLQNCEAFGWTTPAVLMMGGGVSQQQLLLGGGGGGGGAGFGAADEPQTIGMEARKLRALLLRLMEYE